MADPAPNLKARQRVSKKQLDIPMKRTKLCSAVTITGCGHTVRLLGVSSLNLGRADVWPNFFAYLQTGIHDPDRGGYRVRDPA